jgi:hypothetical protein
MISWLNEVFLGSTSAAGAPDALPASDNDKPTALNTGTAFLRRFSSEAFFACDMAQTPVLAGIAKHCVPDTIAGKVPGQVTK